MKRLAMAVAALAVLISIPASADDPSLSRAANEAFLTNNARKPGVFVRPSGLQYRVIQYGNGRRPGPLDKVTVYYSGSLINGKVFDSTEQGLPATFQVNKLIPGWTEALQLMREGDHWQLVIPAKIAYGTSGAGDGLIPPDQVLIFDLELLTVTPAPPKKPGQDDEQDDSGQ
jgi:FKBP-type peptidyl-prolyl cis-trans isomerase